MDPKQIISGCLLIKEGKPLIAEPVSGTIAVRPLANGVFTQVNGVDVVDALSAAYPKCHFLWLAKPAAAPEVTAPPAAPEVTAPPAAPEVTAPPAAPESGKKSKK